MPSTNKPCKFVNLVFDLVRQNLLGAINLYYLYEVLRHFFIKVYILGHCQGHYLSDYCKSVDLLE